MLNIQKRWDRQIKKKVSIVWKFEKQSNKFLKLILFLFADDYIQISLYSHSLVLFCTLWTEYVFFNELKTVCKPFLYTFPSIPSCLYNCAPRLLWKLRQDYFNLRSRADCKIPSPLTEKMLSHCCSHHFYIIYVLPGLLSLKARWSTLKKRLERCHAPSSEKMCAAHSRYNVIMSHLAMRGG